jgi:D-arabinose 1-dehydrogenase-like Zn-dependent alcohol dehydrogenase
MVAISRGADKEKFARQLGTHEHIDTTKVEAGAVLQEMGGVSLIVTISPIAEQISELLRGLRPMGKLLILSCAIPEFLLSKAMQVNYENSPGRYPLRHHDDGECYAMGYHGGVESAKTATAD